MILVDTSVWVDHLRVGNEVLTGLLNTDMVLTHPFVVGELALGNVCQRDVVLDALFDLPRSAVATEAEVLHFIDHHALFGRGVGYIDVHLLAAARLTADVALWTNDKRLHAIAGEMGVAFSAR